MVGRLNNLIKLNEVSFFHSDWKPAIIIILKTT